MRSMVHQVMVGDGATRRINGVEQVAVDRGAIGYSNETVNARIIGSACRAALARMGLSPSSGSWREKQNDEIRRRTQKRRQRAGSKA